MRLCPSTPRADCRGHLFILAVLAVRLTMVAWTRFPPPRWHSAGLFRLVIYGLGAENVSCVRVLMVPASPFSLVFPVDTSLVWYLTLLFSIWFFFFCFGGDSHEFMYHPPNEPDYRMLNFQELFLVPWVLLCTHICIIICIIIYNSFFMNLGLSDNHSNFVCFPWSLT